MFLIRDFVGFFKKVGFSLGSSRWLIQSLIGHADILGRPDITILELGAGDGRVTRAILASLGTGSRLIAIEQEEHRFIELQEIVDPRLTTIHGDARDIGLYSDRESIDVIISTLPLGSIDPDGVEEILAGAQRVLKTGGSYIQYQYWMANKHDVKRHFHIQKIGFEPRNLSPAFIYISQKLPCSELSPST